MRNYELMTIFRPDLEEEALQAAFERLNSIIVARQGEVNSSDSWGRRRMAYSINDFRDGIYNVTQIKLDPKASDDLERSLHLNDQIIRYILVRKD